jgi:hypothetical protein
VTISDLTPYSKKKDVLANACVARGLYCDWMPFSPTEVRQFIALYILQGLSPSPKVKMNFVL